MIKCDSCPDPATFLVFAAGYTASQVLSCNDHLGDLITADMVNQGSTNRWLVEPVRR
jgi:hypothetical protein